MTEQNRWAQLGLVAVVFVPWIGAILQALFPQALSLKARKEEALPRVVALCSGALAMVIAWSLLAGFQPIADLQSLVSFPWLSHFSIYFSLALDGAGLAPLLLVSTLFPVLILFEWNRPEGRRGLHGLLLFLQGALAGAVLAQDIFLQFLFWSVTVLPLFFGVGYWGGENREKAAMSIVLHHLIGNGLLFASVLLLYFAQDPHSFSVQSLQNVGAAPRVLSVLGTDFSYSFVAFSLMTLGFFVRMPCAPFMSAFSPVLAEAPFSLSVGSISAVVPVGLLLWVKNSAVFFPSQLFTAASPVAIFGAVNLLVACVQLFAQRDLRGVLLYLSQVILGLFCMGVGSLSVAGFLSAILGISLGAASLAGLGLVFGALRNRASDSLFVGVDGEKSFGGVAVRAPLMAVSAGLFSAGILGVPGTSGFVTFSLLGMGIFREHLGLLGVLAAATFALAFALVAVYRALFLGKLGTRSQAIEELQLREKIAVLPLAVVVLLFGIYPQPFIEMVRPTLQTLLSLVNP